MKTAILTVVLALASTAASAQSPLTEADLQGAWKLASLTYDGKPQTVVGYLVIAGHHYAFVTTRERPKLTREVGDKDTAQLSSEEKDLFVEAFRSMTAAAGTYRIQKGEVQFLREAVRSPHLAGTYENRPSRIEKGMLVQDFVGGGRRQVYTWQRVSAGASTASK